MELMRVILMDMFYILIKKIMNKSFVIKAIVLALFATFANCVEFVLKPNEPTCTILISSFDVLHT
jgi:hypothetical protein